MEEGWERSKNRGDGLCDGYRYWERDIVAIYL